jgi:hypothetical protein
LPLGTIWSHSLVHIILTKGVKGVKSFVDSSRSARWTRAVEV